MPKKIIKKPSFLIPNNKFQETENADNARDLEDDLTELINTANKLYNEAYLANKFYLKYPEKFITCIKNYTEIKTIINNSHIQSDLIELYDLEACLAIIQAQLNSINTNPTTRKVLESTEREITTIKKTFDILNSRITKLASELKNTNYTSSLEQLLEVRNSFLARWDKDSNERKAHSYYNLAKTLEKKSNDLESQGSKKLELLKEVQDLLATSFECYERAELFDFAEQTKKQLNELSFNLKTIPVSEKIKTSVKIDPTIFSISYSIKPARKITDKIISPLLLSKNLLKISNSAIDKTSSHQKGEKRLAFDEPSCFSPAKKSKLFEIDDDISAIKKSLVHKLPLPKPLDECKVIVQNNRAVTIITKDLQSPKLLPAKKRALLNKAKALLEKSAKFYKQANLLKKRKAIQRAIRCIESEPNLKNLAFLFISTTPENPTPSIEKKEYRAESIATTENIASDRVAYYTRYANNCLFNSFSEGNTLKDKNQSTMRQPHSLRRA